MAFSPHSAVLLEEVDVVSMYITKLDSSAVCCESERATDLEAGTEFLRCPISISAFDPNLPM